MPRFYDDWPVYVTAEERRKKAARALEKLRKRNRALSPILLEGRTIARTFWGKAWCENLERYSDFANRLPRGRNYVRNGCVVDLKIKPGMVRAIVSGSEMYDVEIKVSAVPKKRWSDICTDCAGAIDSLIELLQGRLSHRVMSRICDQRTGLFPSPAEIHFSCSCPDDASMCKHVAAVLYGIGARLDEKPELLFTLRKVNQQDLIAKAGQDMPIIGKMASSERLLETAGLSDLFGIEIVQHEEIEPPKTKRKAREKT